MYFVCCYVFYQFIWTFKHFISSFKEFYIFILNLIISHLFCRKSILARRFLSTWHGKNPHAIVLQSLCSLLLGICRCWFSGHSALHRMTGFLHTSSASGFPGLLVPESSVRVMWVVTLLLKESWWKCRCMQGRWDRLFPVFYTMVIESRAWSQTAFSWIFIWSRFQSLPKLKIKNMSACASRNHIVCTI